MSQRVGFLILLAACATTTTPDPGPAASPPGARPVGATVDIFGAT